MSYNVGDISNYGMGIGSVGGVSTPFLSTGASNPMAAALKSQATSGGNLASGISGIGGVATPGLTGTQMPGVGGSTGSTSGSGFGFNAGTANLVLGGIQMIGNLWQAWEANKLAKQQFAASKGFANANLANQIQSYNTTLADRSRARTFTEGGTAADSANYIAENSLEKKQI